MKIMVDGVIRDATPEEIAEFEREAMRFELEERTRPLTEAEVSRMIITAQINTLEVDDNTALRMMDFYPEWVVNTAYETGFKVQYKDALYKVQQPHTSQIGWEPDATASLWVRVNETHAGTKDDPIPYNGNMVLEQGLYYMPDYIIYECTRDTVNPVYNALSELVGLYVELA